MNELQALVTGSLVSAMISKCDDPLDVEVEVATDDDGNYLPWFFVVGRESGDRVQVRVNLVPTSSLRRAEKAPTEELPNLSPEEGLAMLDDDEDDDY